MYPSYFTNDIMVSEFLNISKYTVDPTILLNVKKMLPLFMLRRLKEEVAKLEQKKIKTKVRILNISISFILCFIIKNDFVQKPLTTTMIKVHLPFVNFLKMLVQRIFVKDIDTLFNT